MVDPMNHCRNTLVGFHSAEATKQTSHLLGDRKMTEQSNYDNKTTTKINKLPSNKQRGHSLKSDMIQSLRQRCYT